MKTLTLLLVLMSLCGVAFANSDKWERVSEHYLIYRTKMPHGWLVVQREWQFGPSGIGGVAYVPDENHEWRLE